MQFIAHMENGLRLCCVLCLGVSSCSLITVPVKTVGSIVTTTVSTTGRVVAAPFEAVGRRSSSSEDATASETSGTKTQVLDRKPQQRETPPDETNQ
jgi:hypothetical protein